MKKLITTLSLIAIGFNSAFSQITENRVIQSFTALQLYGAYNLNYTNSDTLKLTITAAEKEISKIETQVKNGVLIIENKGTFRNPITINLSAASFKNLETSGAVYFKSLNQLNVDTLFISSNGASKVVLNVNAQKINVTQSGASTLFLKGKTQKLFANVSGASTLKSYELVAQEAIVKADGAATAKIYVEENIEANASGASSIKIKGEPKILNANASAAASVSKVNSEKAVTQKEDADDNDTIVVKLKRKNVLIINSDSENKKAKKIKGDTIGTNKHWQGFYIGVNGYMNTNGGFDIPKKSNYMDLNYSRSFNLQYNMFEKHVDIIKNHFKVVTGLGFDQHFYRFQHKTNLNADSSYTWGKIDSTNSFNYKKNKFYTAYLQVPLLFEINTSKHKNKSFHIAFGVVGQYLLFSKTRQELEQNKYEITKERKDNYNLSPFAAKAHVNLGYKNVNVFAEYNLTPLFQNGKGPMLYPFSVGIKLFSFD